MRILVFVFVFFGVLSAHSLKIFAKEENSQISVKSYFYGGSACKNCLVELINDGAVLTSAKTNNEGVANFALPNKKEIIIKVHAGSGHFKELAYTLKTENSIVSENSTLADDSVFEGILKGFGSVLAILAIFALIYFTKKRSICLL